MKLEAQCTDEEVRKRYGQIKELKDQSTAASFSLGKCLILTGVLEERHRKRNRTSQNESDLITCHLHYNYRTL